MFLHLALVVATICSSQGLPRPAPPQAAQTQQSQLKPIEQQKPPVLFQRQQFQPDLPYDLALLEPQFQIPPYNYIGNKQHFPRVQPQLVLYHGGSTPGQPFLIQPGSPPRNYLVPQGGPNVIIRDAPQGPAPAPAPPRPVFVAGYPKPAHIPPIEKDAEEVPTNPSKIPPLTPKTSKPEKLENFNEDEPPKKHATEADVLAAADQNPAYNPKTNLRPGQRFFILNGQPLFSNFPYNNQIYPGIQSNVNLKFAQDSPNFISPTPKTLQPYPDFVLRNGPIGDIPANPDFNGAQLQQGYPDNLVLLNQPGSFQDNIFQNPASSNFEEEKIGKAQFREDFNLENFGQLLRFRDNGAQDDESVVIDAGEQQHAPEDDVTEAEDEVVAADKPVEPTIAQAQPGAIALAGPGGVAAAAPRGTAFVGKEGIAVSSPQATAVAGPSRDGNDEVVEEGEKKKKNQGKRRS